MRRRLLRRNIFTPVLRKVQAVLVRSVHVQVATPAPSALALLQRRSFVPPGSVQVCNPPALPSAAIVGDGKRIPSVCFCFFWVWNRRVPLPPARARVV